METTTDKILNKIDEWGNSFFLRLENMNTNELVVVVLGGTVALLTYGKMKSGIVMHKMIIILQLISLYSCYYNMICFDEMHLSFSCVFCLYHKPLRLCVHVMIT